MRLKVLALILPRKNEAHDHVEDIFVKCFINISIEKFLANQCKNFSMVPPIHILIFDGRIFRVFWFYFDKMRANRSDLKDNQNQWETVHAIQRRVLTDLENIS